MSSEKRLERLLELWPHLSAPQRGRIHKEARKSLYRLPRPVRFALIQALFSLLLAGVMPPHPLALPTIYGGAMALALIVWALR